MAEMFCLLELGITKIPAKLTKDKVKEKKGEGVDNLLEIAPLNTLVDALPSHGGETRSEGLTKSSCGIETW